MYQIKGRKNQSEAMPERESRHQDSYFFPLPDWITGAERYHKQNVVITVQIQYMFEPQF